MKIRYLVYDGKGKNISFQKNSHFFPSAEKALRIIETETADLVFLINHKTSIQKNFFDLPEEIDQFDLIHTGLSFGAANAFQNLWFLNTNWMSLNPTNQHPSSSWKALPNQCLIKPNIIRALGGFDQAYMSAEARLMDFSFRLLKFGGRILNKPIDSNTSIKNQYPISFTDELIFVLRHNGIKSAWYILLWSILGGCNPWKAIHTFQSAKNRILKFSAPEITKNLDSQLHLVGINKRQRVGNISGIIPTLNRYEYLPQAITSLLKQSPKLLEIIVVDQTPLGKRQSEIYAQYDDRVRIIYLDEAGQSVARNTAIQASKGEWCLFFDDDSMAWENMLYHHIDLIEHTGATISTGVSLAPWKTVEHIPENRRYPHITSVLDSGNCLIKKQVLLDVGGFDRAFDRGPGADHDLGVRLFLKGYEIVFNPLAIRTHYKAISGGLRTYEAWWPKQAELWGPYPSPSKVYTIWRYYPRKYWFALYYSYYLKMRHSHNLFERLWLWFSSPWKIDQATKSASLLQTRFIDD